MDGTKEAPTCRQCGKKLKPNYKYLCTNPECKHDKIWHSFSAGASMQGCQRTGNGQKCKCESTQATGEFLKALQGYGIYDGGTFCTRGCAVDWAIYNVRGYDDIINVVREVGFKVNPPETASGAVRNLAQAYVSMGEAAVHIAEKKKKAASRLLSQAKVKAWVDFDLDQTGCALNRTEIFVLAVKLVGRVLHHPEEFTMDDVVTQK